MTHFHLPHRATGTGTRVEERTRSPPLPKQPKKGSARTVPRPKGTFPNQRSPKPSLLVSVSTDRQDGRARTSWAGEEAEWPRDLQGDFWSFQKTAQAAGCLPTTSFVLGLLLQKCQPDECHQTFQRKAKADPVAVWVCAQAGISFTQQISGERAWPLQCPDPKRGGTGLRDAPGTTRGTPTATQGSIQGHPAPSPGTPKWHRGTPGGCCPYIDVWGRSGGAGLNRGDTRGDVGPEGGC